MNKKLTAAILAATLALASVMPAYAAVTRTESFGDGSTLYYTDNGDDISYPGWIWVDGYCYYYQNPGTILKNTTTPDGYTVDAEGRWVVDGTVQTNGYGSYSMGTADYAGKSDDEIWDIMKAKLQPVFLSGIAISDGAVMSLAQDSIAADIAYGAFAGNDITISHNFSSYGTYITAMIGAAWSDDVHAVTNAIAKTAYAMKAPIKEKTIKAVVGDQVGQELFNYIRTHADKTTPGYIMETDENGNPIRGWYETVLDGNGWVIGKNFTEDPNGPEYKSVFVNNSGDGIHAETLDLSAWQNRTTDYGKRFSVVYDGGLRIHVYN